ncbi:MAG: hypothetical protein LBC99_08630 [Spirochaetota bacterium]|jgi:hypothetical protein|nr:hypothetical protein [Spirochaetota bacterium]
MRFHCVIIFIVIIFALFFVSCSAVGYPDVPLNNLPGWPSFESLSIGEIDASYKDNGRYYLATLVFPNDVTQNEDESYTTNSVADFPLNDIVINFRTDPADATVWVGTRIQTSGVTANDFSDGKRKVFIIRAGDGSLNEYRVGVYNENDVPDESDEPGSGGGETGGGESAAILAFPGADFTGAAGTKVARGAHASGYAGGASVTSDFAQFFVGGFNDTGTCLRLKNVNDANVTANGAVFVAAAKFIDPDGRTRLSFWVRGTALVADADGNGGTVAIMFGNMNSRASANPGFVLTSSAATYNLETGNWSYNGAGLDIPEWKKITVNLASASDEFVIEDTQLQIRGGRTVTGNSTIRRNWDLYFDDFRYEVADEIVEPPPGGSEESEGTTTSVGSSNLVFQGSDFEGTLGGAVGRTPTSVTSAAGITAISWISGTTNFAKYAEGTAGNSLRLYGNISANGNIWGSPSGIYAPGSNTKITFWMRGTVSNRTIGIHFLNAGTPAADNPFIILSGACSAGTYSFKTTGTAANVNNANTNAGINTGDEWKEITIDLSTLPSGYNITGKPFVIYGGGSSTDYDLYFDEVRYEEGEVPPPTSEAPGSSGGGGAASSAPAVASPDGLAFPGADFAGSAGSAVPTASGSYATGFGATASSVRVYATADNPNGDFGTCLNITGTAGGSSSGGALYMSPDTTYDPGSNTMITFWMKGTSTGVSVLLGTGGGFAANPGVSLAGITDASTDNFTMAASGTVSYTGTIELNGWKKITLKFGSLTSTNVGGKNFQIRGAQGKSHNLLIDDIRYE